MDFTKSNKNRISIFLYKVIIILNAIWRIIRPLGFALFNLSIVLVILTVSDQSRDVLREVYENPDIFYLYYFLTLFAYAISIYVLSILSLKLVNIHDINKDENNWDHRTIKEITDWGIKNLPAFLSICPFLILTFAFINADESIWGLFPLLCIVSAIVLFVIHWRKLKKEQNNKKSVLQINSKAEPLKEIFNKQNNTIRWKDIWEIVSNSFKEYHNNIVFYTVIFLLALLYIVTIIVIFIFQAKFGFNTLLMLLYAATFWLVLPMILNVISLRYAIPVISIFIIWIWFCSFFNNNHLIRVSYNKNDENLRERFVDSVYVRRWVKTYIQETNATTESPAKVYLVAGEGGGIRAAYWTSNILAKFQKDDPSFYRKVLMMTGVSGSSVGLGFYQGVEKTYQDSLVKFPLPNDIIRQDAIAKNIKNIGGKDFLSPLVVAFLLPDMVQRMLPFTISSYDRAKYLEDGFSHYFNREMNFKGSKELLKRNFLNVCPANDFKQPIILFNSTEVESGRKGIISNVFLTERYFNDVVDILKKNGKDMPFVTAATLSARFPIVTPPGLVKDAQDKALNTHFVDGGYFENTSLHTTFQILRILDELPESDKGRIQPIIIFLKNGSTRLKVKTTKNFYEFTPLKAFVNAWDRKSIPILHDFRETVTKIYTSSTLNAKARIKVDSVNRNINIELPLGWTLSKNAQDSMDIQIKKHQLF